ncbi:MAG: DUF4832 domain-containing protein [Pleurocapsa sp. CRU_1_2]|nr:DUF4832 domain-containing protein [Pleurocapsa sp. CRU_1_2]
MSFSVAMAISNLAQSDNLKQVAFYQPSSENFANPERGLFIQYNPLDNTPQEPLQVSELRAIREDKITLIRTIYLISQFKEVPLSDSFLDRITADLAAAREAGVKVIMRFSYNWLDGGDDATEAIILAHQEQLRPMLEDNYDVIAFMEAGFIGHWGEWHSSTHNLNENPQARKNILFNLLSILPAERMVAVRYTHHKRDAFNNNTPLKSLAVPGTNQRARVGAHNDCFLASADDFGTYDSLVPREIATQKAFLHQDNLFVVQGGELCHYNPPRTNCPTALAELEQMRWSALNYYLPKEDLNIIFQDWEKQACLPEITRRLGYRLRLVKSELNQRAIAKGVVDLQFTIFNDGWASLYNPRALEVILRHQTTGKEYTLLTSVNPRQWQPNSEQTVKMKIDLPQDIVAGNYQVFLNMPDPHTRLSNRPEFSVRLANQNLWESNSGYNYLYHVVTIPELDRHTRLQPKFLSLSQTGEQL